MDIAWVPDPNDGGAPLYGYKVNVWTSNANGDPTIAVFAGVAL